jgi:hypothetical protein
MIENDHQLQVTKEELEKLKYGLQHFGEHGQDGVWLIIKAQRDGLKSVIETLEEEIREYEQKKPHIDTPPNF